MSDNGFISLKALAGRGPATPDEILAEIRSIYFKTTRQTIQNDLAHAIDLLKKLPDEEARERATVYMDGLAQMRSDWARASSGARKVKGQTSKARPPGKVRS